MHNLQQPRMPMVDPSHFAMVPRSDVPRSTFQTTHTHKTTLDTDYLYPIFVDEVLPGDVFKGDVTIFARLSNLLFPLMDNLEVETFFFFVPNRLTWDNWTKMMGEQATPSSSISYTVPQLVSPSGGFIVGGLADHFGLPTVGQVAAGATVSVNALPFRGYNLTFNEWFRDQNLMDSVAVPKGDGPDNIASYNLEKRCKKHDYFTSALPWPLKGGAQISLPIGGQATVKTQAVEAFLGAQEPVQWRQQSGLLPTANRFLATATTNSKNIIPASTGPAAETNSPLYPSNLYADLSTATGATINAMRLAIATQQFLEKDARGGTRYTELLHNHFGVQPEDFRLQRPEYIGGGRTPVQTAAIPQTSATGLTGGTTPVGSLTGQATVAANHHFQYHATEHGYILGLVNVTGDVTYQQGLHRMWTRQTRFDFYWPTFANLGEQAVRNDEIYCRGDANDALTFGYQERWAEYRYRNSQITGLFRSTGALNIDEWHLSQQFPSLPTLNATFIRQATPMIRVLAAGSQANTMQILLDSVFSISCTRAIPVYSVPGLTRL